MLSESTKKATSFYNYCLCNMLHVSYCHVGHNNSKFLVKFVLPAPRSNLIRLTFWSNWNLILCVLSCLMSILLFFLCSPFNLLSLLIFLLVLVGSLRDHLQVAAIRCHSLLGLFWAPFFLVLSWYSMLIVSRKRGIFYNLSVYSGHFYVTWLAVLLCRKCFTSVF